MKKIKLEDLPKYILDKTDVYLTDEQLIELLSHDTKEWLKRWAKHAEEYSNNNDPFAYKTLLNDNDEEMTIKYYPSSINYDDEDED